MSYVYLTQYSHLYIIMKLAILKLKTLVKETLADDREWEHLVYSCLC